MTDRNDELDPRESARIRRRAQDATAEQRSLLRPGMAKVFKQIQDRQRQDALDASSAPPRPRRRQGRRGPGAQP
jgi:hypothetical protein